MASDNDIESTILSLIETVESGKSVSPEEVARAIAGKDPAKWGKLMKQVRSVAVRLANQERLVILRKGKPADPADFKGVYRLAPPAPDKSDLQQRPVNE